MTFSREEIEEIEGWVGSPTLPKVFDGIEQKFIEAWKQAKNVDDREYCWRMIRCARQVQAEFSAIVDSPKVDQHNASRARANDWTLPKPTNGQDL